DAWRLALADAPLLLSLTGLFAVPAFAVLLLLLTRPTPDALAERLLLPAVTAVLLPLTGIGSGASQELLRRRADGRRVTLGVCLWGGLRRGAAHAAGRAAALLIALPGVACLAMFLWLSLTRESTGLFAPLLLVGFFLVGLALWLTHAVHPLIAGGDVGAF